MCLLGTFIVNTSFYILGVFFSLSLSFLLRVLSQILSLLTIILSIHWLLGGSLFTAHSHSLPPAQSWAPLFVWYILLSPHCIPGTVLDAGIWQQPKQIQSLLGGCRGSRGSIQLGEGVSEDGSGRLPWGWKVWAEMEYFSQNSIWMTPSIWNSIRPRLNLWLAPFPSNRPLP